MIDLEQGNVIDNPALVKPQTGLVYNIDISGYRSYRLSKDNRKRQADRIDSLEDQIRELREMMTAARVVSNHITQPIVSGSSNVSELVKYLQHDESQDN